MSSSPPSLLRRLSAWLGAGLSPEGAAGVQLTLGLILLAVATTAFGILAEDVVSGARITIIDVQMANWLHARATPAMTGFMLGVSNVHGAIGGVLISMAMIAYFHLRRHPWWGRAALIILPGGMLLNVLIKYSFQRARPTFDAPLLTLTTYSFPSGHTAFAAMFYGLLACFMLVHQRAPRSIGMRCLIVVAAVAMVALVAGSRMYLGVHYLSDVLGAMAEGCAWLTICITGISTWRRRREGRPLYR
jgi:membrane-associated phospholipid phosphatase